ncbi:MAG: hypothetical protein U5L45_22435 [Saprospiraceae bacterium]|nr:hypothetical protein [Saprospiraceae bacterium]
MLNNILSDIQKILRGKNGTVFFVILGLLAVIFFLKALPSLIDFSIVTLLSFDFQIF